MHGIPHVFWTINGPENVLAASRGSIVIRKNLILGGIAVVLATAGCGSVRA